MAGLVDAGAERFVARHQPVDPQPPAGVAEGNVRRLDPDQASRRVHVEAEKCLGQRSGSGG